MSLQIDTIDTLAEFERVADNWRTLYAADGSANIFLHWSWLRDWFEVTPYDWQVLAARQAGKNGYVAFFPIATTTLRSCGVGLQTLLYLGGTPLADYTGFVCDSRHTEQAVKAFARHLKENVAWHRFRAVHLMDDRADLFFAEFQDSALIARAEDPVSCPYLELPDTFDAYLLKCMSNSSRYNLRRRIRQVEAVAEFRSTRTGMSTVDEHLYVVLHMWQGRWGRLAPRDEERYHRMYRLALDDGRLCVHLLWDGATPMAGLIAFVDPVKRHFCYHISGFNPDYERLSPGKAIVGHSIRYAIENGYRVYDFLLGGEAYKVDYFGATPRYAKSFTVERRGLKYRVRRRLARWLLPRKRATVSANGSAT